MDGRGTPVVRKESADRVGKQDGQPSHTREVKLGRVAPCVFVSNWHVKLNAGDRSRDRRAILRNEANNSFTFNTLAKITGSVRPSSKVRTP